ncbi:hypothetical protein F5X68DRAFT_211825 [Plectosphaerella plurivora]|uniref:Secreted protein n=1 Tax=Plectosphaerella plurivora TaxID=936078 RepID=A0A9P8V895_9PEZI|nr:hypothetical protein F5X68DRAFT_211825 [Plectosphaerella plurivora]
MCDLPPPSIGGRGRTAFALLMVSLGGVGGRAGSDSRRVAASVDPIVFGGTRLERTASCRGASSWEGGEGSGGRS